MPTVTKITGAVHFYALGNMDFIDAYNIAFMRSKEDAKIATFDHKHCKKVEGVTTFFSRSAGRIKFAVDRFGSGGGRAFTGRANRNALKTSKTLRSSQRQFVQKIHRFPFPDFIQTACFSHAKSAG